MKKLENYDRIEIMRKEQFWRKIADGKIILTGDRPTGKLHVGHYVGSLKRRVSLQNSGDFDDIFIILRMRRR